MSQQITDRIRVSKNFYLDEFYDVKTYHDFISAGKKQVLIDGICPNMLKGLQSVRDFMGVPMSINDWWASYVKFGGDLDKTLAHVRAKKIDQWSGGRVKGSPYYTPNSKHTLKFDKNKDIIKGSLKATDSGFGSLVLLNKAQKYIYEKWREIGITRMEVNVTWLHIDSGGSFSQGKLFTFDADSIEPNWKPKF